MTSIDDRNYTAHAYSEILADKIYNDLPQALDFFQKVAETIMEAKN